MRQPEAVWYVYVIAYVYALFLGLLVGRVTELIARYQIHGHDFVEILGWYLRQKGVRGEVTQPQNIGNFLAMSIECDVLASNPAFVQLLERAS
jgi:hypothetical protein